MSVSRDIALVNFSNYPLQALLTGLAVMCPDDPLQFILDKLRCLKENGMEELNWYCSFL